MTEVGITIHETVEDVDDLPEILRVIADWIDKGCTSGYQPGWEITWSKEERKP